MITFFKLYSRGISPIRYGSLHGRVGHPTLSVLRLDLLQYLSIDIPTYLDMYYISSNNPTIDPIYLDRYYISPIITLM